MKQQGVVVRFQMKGGFGFILSEGQSLFFHIRHVLNGYVLEPGDEVEFTPGPSLKISDKTECFDVTLIARKAEVSCE